MPAGGAAAPGGVRAAVAERQIPRGDRPVHVGAGRPVETDRQRGVARTRTGRQLRRRAAWRATSTWWRWPWRSRCWCRSPSTWPYRCPPSGRCGRCRRAGCPLPVASGLPSPNDRSHVVMVPSASVLADPSKLTGSGALPEPGLADNCASGGPPWRPRPHRVVAVAVWLLLSVTVRVAV
jgi:hypothetical protein